MSHFCIYFYQTTMWVFFWKNHYSVFLNHLCRGSNGENSLLLRNLSRICGKYYALKRIYFHFVRKRRAGRRSNRGTSHFVWCETKLNNYSMLCIKFCLYCVWQFVYFLYKNFYVVYGIFWLLFFYIVYDIKSEINFFNILYNTFHILQFFSKCLS